jgi:hypothetical protein
MLEKPRSEDNLGFLQFLKMAINLKELEIRLPQRTNNSSPDPSTIRRPDAQSSSPPAPLKTSLTHLRISYRDLLEIIPLFMPNPRHPAIPVILLPALHHITFLPETQSPDSTTTVLPESHPYLIDSFLQRTKAKITHIELDHHGQIWRKLTSSMDEGDTDIEIDPAEGEQREATHQITLSLIKQFHSCEILEVWGKNNVDCMLHILDIKTQKKGSVSENTPKTRPIPWTEAEASSHSKTSPKQQLLPEQPLHAEPHSMGTDVTNLPLGRGRTFKDRPAKRNSLADSFLSLFPSGGSPANGKSTKSPSPAPSQKNEGKKRVREIIASVVASGQRPPARVRTPEHTPRITAKDLVNEPASVAPSVNSRSRVTSEVTSNPSVATDALANTRASVSNTSTPERISTSILPSRSPLLVNEEHILPSLDRVIIHDAAPDDLKLRDYLNLHGIGVEIHR